MDQFLSTTGEIGVLSGVYRLETSDDLPHQNTIWLHVPAPLAVETEQLLCALPRVKKVHPMDESPGWFVVEVVNLSNISSPYMSNHILEALFRAHIPILTYESKTGLKDVSLSLTEETSR